jgi:hypothetical protein
VAGEVRSLWLGSGYRYIGATGFMSIIIFYLMDELTLRKIDLQMR